METEPCGWTYSWDEKSDEWLEGYCVGRHSIFFEFDYAFSQHYDDHEGCVYVFDELGEEE